MSQIQLRLSLCFFLLLFSLIACQQNKIETDAIPTEIATKSIEEDEPARELTPVTESSEVDESNSVESTESDESNESLESDENELAESAEANENDSADNSEVTQEQSYPAPEPEATEATEAEETAEESYPPPPTINTTDTAYPEPAQTETSDSLVESDSYPAPTEVVVATSTPTLLSGERFELAPLQAGDTEVRGRGPAGLPIALVDVSLGGDLITTGKIEEDGTFIMKVPQPLESNHHLGLKVGPLYGAPFADQEEVVMQDARLLLGDHAFDLPNIGLILTSQHVP